MYITSEHHYGINVKSVSLLGATLKKSYYGKAKIVRTADEEYLQSYETLVAYINKRGEFVRLWDDWSVTTMKHVNDVRMAHSLPTLSKKEWCALKVEKH